jgi:hypothetical protein
MLLWLATHPSTNARKQATQAYPAVFGEMMASIFSAAGVDFVATNGAMGNNDVQPYLWCLEAAAGSHPDVVTWEVLAERKLHILSHQRCTEFR